MKKTNAVRILESLKMPFILREFAVDKSDFSAERAAKLLGVKVDQIYKTLVVRGDQSGVIIASIPGGSELDLKALAHLSSNKRVEMVPLKELQPLTGYFRGAVSPLSMKYNYRYYLDESAFCYSSVIISAGTHGLQIELAPRDLITVTGAVAGIITRHD